MCAGCFSSSRTGDWSLRQANRAANNLPSMQPPWILDLTLILILALSPLCGRSGLSCSFQAACTVAPFNPRFSSCLYCRGAWVFGTADVRGAELCVARAHLTDPTHITLNHAAADAEQLASILANVHSLTATVHSNGSIATT